MLLIVGILLIFGLIAAVTKTKWLPSPSAWLKALGLAVPTWVGAVAVFSLEVWHFIFLLILAVGKHSSSATSVFLAFAAGFLAVSLVWYLLLVLLYSLLLRSLWLELPQFLHWIKPPSRWRDIFFGWAVSTLAVLVGAAPFLMVAFYSSKLILETMQQWGLTDEDIIGKMFIGWYVTAAYLYQVRGLLSSVPLRRKA